MEKSRPRSRFRLFIRIVLALLSILLILYSIASWQGYEYATKAQPAFPTKQPNVPFEEVNFKPRGGTYDVYAFYLQGKAGYPALIVTHGYRGSRYNDLDVVEALNKLGYAVLAIDLSDNGGKTIGNGRITFGFEERWDVLGGFDYLLTRGLSADQIGLLGFSMGATTDLMAALLEPRIKAIWADSGFTQATQVLIEQAANNGFPSFIVPGAEIFGAATTGIRLWEVHPIDAGGILRDQGQVVYIVHCQTDTVVWPHHGKDFADTYQRAGVNVQFWGAFCTSHTRAFREFQQEYLHRLDEFFKKHLRFAS